MSENLEESAKAAAMGMKRMNLTAAKIDQIVSQGQKDVEALQAMNCNASGENKKPK